MLGVMTCRPRLGTLASSDSMMCSIRGTRAVDYRATLLSTFTGVVMMVCGLTKVVMTCRPMKWCPMTMLVPVVMLLQFLLRLHMQ